MCEFNVYINFNVSKNPEKIKNSHLNNDIYTPCYIPSEKFINKQIVIKNLKSGDKIDFFEKECSFELEELLENKTKTKKDTNSIVNYDIGIEFYPINFDKNNEIVFITLCNIEKMENEKHNYGLKCEIQRLKTNTCFIDLFDIFNSALESGECLICCTRLRNTIFLPCHHSCTCNLCAHSLKMRNNPCPICKNDIDDLVILEVQGDKLKPENYDIHEEKNEDIEELDSEGMDDIGALNNVEDRSDN